MLLEILCKYLWLAVLINSACTPNAVSTKQDGIKPLLTEKSRQEQKANGDWWLNSGAYVYKTESGFETIQGELEGHDPFRILYSATNPVDTDNGYKPQNLLRLVNNHKFGNFSQQVFFKINRLNLSDSPNRNQSNGVFFLHRYHDGNNLYYVGIRVDGYAVIKKKLHGKYTTLKTTRVYPGVYEHSSSPNLLPINRKIGIKTIITNTGNSDVNIKMFINDPQISSDWKQVLETVDTAPDANEKILDQGYAGIRTDFMDVSFYDYDATEIHDK